MSYTIFTNVHVAIDIISNQGEFYMENEKISTIFTYKKVEYLLKNANSTCYRYGTSEELEDILIPSEICN
jgi:hypothetical protein